MKVVSVIVASLASLLFSAAPLAASPTPCPKLAPARPASSKPAGRGLLVPKGAGGVLLCRYGGLNAPAPRGLERERLVTSRARIARLTTDFDALRPQPPGIVNCPLDDGSEIVATFRYPSRGEDVVTVGLSGCRLVGNGVASQRTASSGAGTRVLAALTALIP
jgi:hypothetical protein